MEEVNSLYSETVRRARENGAVDQEAWDSIVDEVVEEYRTQGKIHDDEETDGMAEELRHRFEEYEEMIRQEGL